MIRIVAISDTHGLHDEVAVPDGDILIHAGDMTRRGELEAVRSFNAFLGRQPHRHKIVIAGNHDFCFERTPAEAVALLTNCTYLLDQAVSVCGLRIYGSPWQPWYHNWAFNLHPGPDLRAKWDLIPRDTDVLVTHGPPYGIHDRTVVGVAAGCVDLLAAVREVRPRLHIFGHIHEGWGMSQSDQTTFINASISTFDRDPTNPPFVFDYEE